MEEVGFVGHISIEIIRIMLLYLPIKFLIQCSSVCKEWYSIIQHPNFQTSYRGRQQRVISFDDGKFLKSINMIDDDDYISICKLHEEQHPFFSSSSSLIRPSFRFMGSCRGLLLVGLESGVYLWNPSTHCSAKVFVYDLLQPPLSYLTEHASGLCYDESTGDYKVVVLKDDTLHVVNCRNKQHKVVKFPRYTIRLDDPICCLGFQDTVHFVARSDMLLYFDPIFDELRTMSTLPETKKRPILGLGVVNDCLCIAIGAYDYYIEMFVMKEYGVKDSWGSAFSIRVVFSSMEIMLNFYSLNKETVVIIEHCEGHDRLRAYNIERSCPHYLLPSECEWNSEICVSWAGVYVESFSQPHLVC